MNFLSVPDFLLQVEQLATLFQRKNKPRLSWVPSIPNPVSVSGVHGLPEFGTTASENPCKSHDPFAEEVGQGSFGISAASEVARGENDCSRPSYMCMRGV